MQNKLSQHVNCNVIQTSKTVEWLTNNTRVRTFDKVSFEGYQREVNKKHVTGIVNYITKEGGIYLPTSIICSTMEEFNDDKELYIVDGQHRVEAFKVIKSQNPELFQTIKDSEISLIVLENPSKKLEIETFITINKTSKKVDTSLALILKNKTNDSEDAERLTISKQEYLAVELGVLLNENKDSIWHNKIMLEGNPTSKTEESISLNAFVKSTKLLIKYLDNYEVITLDWKTKEEFETLLEKVSELFELIWRNISKKWPKLFDPYYKIDSVIQGNIGLSSINKYIILQLKNLGEVSDYNSERFKDNIQKWIKNINIKEHEWYKGNHLSKFSSESGSTLVANLLFDAYDS